MATAGPKAQRASICGSTGAAEAGDPWAIARSLAGGAHRMGSLASDGLEAVLTAAAVERGAQMEDPGRAEVRAIDQVAGVGRATGGVGVM